MSHTFICSNMHPQIINVNCLTQTISLVALSITVNTNQPSSHFSYYMQHTQTHYNTSARYIIIITHASNIWSHAAVRNCFYSFSYLTEDYGYFNARPCTYKYNTTTNAIHTLLDLYCPVELHVTLMTSCRWKHWSIPHCNVTSSSILKQGNTATAVNLNTTSLQH